MWIKDKGIHEVMVFPLDGSSRHKCALRNARSLDFFFWGGEGGQRNFRSITAGRCLEMHKIPDKREKKTIELKQNNYTTCWVEASEVGGDSVQTLPVAFKFTSLLLRAVWRYMLTRIPEFWSAECMASADTWKHLNRWVDVSLVQLPFPVYHRPAWIWSLLRLTSILLRVYMTLMLTMESSSRSKPVFVSCMLFSPALNRCFHGNSKVSE